MLLIYTGKGKGKTSACVGQAVRALGQDMAVAFGQFMKKDGQAGEQRMLRELLGERFLAGGAGFYRGQDFDRHRQKARDVLAWAERLLGGGLDILILDEALYALGHGLLQPDEVRSLVEACRRGDCHVVLSGRGAPDWLVEMADIVSDIGEIKHIYADGGKARPGIEY